MADAPRPAEVGFVNPPDPKPGQEINLARAFNGPTEAVTVISEGPYTIKYRGEDGIVRSLRRRQFIKRTYAAIGEQPPPIKNTLRIVAQPMGGQPGYRRR